MRFHHSHTCHLRRKQMAAHTTWQVSCCVHVARDCERLSALDVSQTGSTPYYVLVALRLTGFTRHMRLDRSIITMLSMGEIRPVCIRISTSQIFVIFSWIKTLNTAFLTVNAALGGSKAAIFLLLGRLLSFSIELARPFLRLQIASCWLVGVGY